MPANLHTRPCGRGGQVVGSVHREGRDAPPTDPSPGAAGGPGTLKADDEVGEGGGCFSGVATASAGGALEDQRQNKETAGRKP